MPTVAWGGHRLCLLSAKAAWLPERHMLLVADVHLGKALSFRRLGVPVPGGTTGDALARLSELLTTTGAHELVILGDFLHSADAQAPALQAQVRSWRIDHAHVAMTLVRGNHDDRAGDPPAALEFVLRDEPWTLPPPSDQASVPGLALCHHPRAVAGHQVLAGHLHPCVVLAGRARQRLRLPCFHFGPEVAVLPAFGGFTGMHSITRQASDQVFAVGGDGVYAL
jgi:DNA ligase-associated metallophosphoesterase